MNEPSCDHTELIEYAISCGELEDPDEKDRAILNRPMRETERIA
jgi:hypothetical protein